MGFQLADLVDGSYSATELKAAHYRAEELKAHGFSAVSIARRTGDLRYMPCPCPCPCALASDASPAELETFAAHMRMLRH